MRRLGLVLMLCCLPATSWGWRYVMYDDGQLAYDGPIPPVDLTYPAPGEPTPMRDADSPQTGAAVSSTEFSRLQSDPHVIIVPPASTIGGRQAEPPAMAPARR